MSELAEYARMLHEANFAAHFEKRELIPIEFPSGTDQLFDIRAVVCDVYGTLVNYWRADFASKELKEKAFLRSFREIAESFNMVSYLQKIHPEEMPEKTLSDFYHGLITLRHDQAKKRGVAFPEIVIEQIWEIIITILMRYGYTLPEENLREFARKIAWKYNFHSLGRRLYPGVSEALCGLKDQNIMIGLLSNAQFYTPIDLTLMIRDQSNGKIDDIFELFDSDLSFLSYEYQVAKPDQLLFRKLYDALYEYQILPAQTVYIGNDLDADIVPAQVLGMKTALFVGDTMSAFTETTEKNVLPDISFTSWTDLQSKISFHSRGAA